MLWDFLVNALRALFMPLVCFYFTLSGSLFLNVSMRDAKGLEKISNSLLTPLQYLLAGKEAFVKSDGSWEFVQRFHYQDLFWIKTTASLCALPPSVVLGTAVKGLSFLQADTRKRFAALTAARNSTEVQNHLDDYRKMGLRVDEIGGVQLPQDFQRKAGDELNLSIEKKALQDIIALLNEAKLPWWLDCGSCLGAYRYGGVIPWDEDIDIALLVNDFENVRHLLNRLDANKYWVQDWSTRDHPDSFLKVYIRENSGLIDLYFFKIQPESRDLRYIFSFESNMFVPEWFKIREQCYKIPASYETVFPLNKTFFDGIEVFVPNDSKKYLQRYFGENLDPVKIYNSQTDRYEKDLTHQFWQTAGRWR